MTEKAAAAGARRRTQSLFACLKAAAQGFIANGGLIVAGHLAFIVLLSLFPFLIFLTALAGFLGQTELGTYFVAFIFEQMPEEVAEVLSVPLLEVLQETRGGLMTIGILLAVWTASSGLEAARVALNRAYLSDRRRPLWRSRGESILLVVAVSVCILIAMLALVLGPVLWAELQVLLRLPDRLRVSWLAVRYGVGAVLLFLAVASMYFLLPAAKLRLRWVLPGTFLVVALWLASATAFSVYLRYFGGYTVTYGSLAGIILALVFFYVLAAVFVFGAEFNGALARAEGGLPPPRRRSEDRLPRRRGGRAN